MLQEDSGSELELRDYLRVLKRRKSVVGLAVALVAGASLIASFIQEPVYASSARLVLTREASESPFDSQSGQRNDPARALATEIEVLKSQLVQDQVRREIGLAPTVSVTPVGNTDVLQVTARSTDPRRAAEIANAYANAYIKIRRDQAVAGLLAAGDQIQEKLGSIQAQIAALDAQVTASPAPDQAVVRESVSAQRQALVQQQALFRQTIDQLTVNADLASGGAELVGMALVTTAPVSPKPVRNAVLAAVVGMLLGIGLAFLVEYLDDSINSREELERIAGTVPVIGLIPAVGNWKTREEARLVSATDPRSAAAEAYRTLRTAIQFVAIDRPMGIIQVTSSNAGEGKTTTLANLGIALATAGERVILVCCDLRRPRLHEFFNLDNAVGFTSMLRGDVPLTRALQEVPGLPRLRVLASGPLPPNPSELLASHRTKQVLSSLKADADVVLVDSPPILPVTDALVLFRQVDATLMVFSVRSTRQKEATAALRMALQVDAPLVGAVLNGVAVEPGYAYRYGYHPRSGTIAAAASLAAESRHDDEPRGPKGDAGAGAGPVPLTPSASRPTDSPGGARAPSKPWSRPGGKRRAAG